MVEYAIRTENLTRDFRTVRAVDRLSIEVPMGCVFGFLGPNGAGKTTTIRLLLGLLEPTEGRAEVLGFDVERLTTLCTGLVLILGTLVEKAFIAPAWKSLLPVAMLLFVSALGVAIWAMLSIPKTIRAYSEVLNTYQTRMIRSSTAWVFLLFFAGMAVTVAFLIRNVFV